jgi:XapX domain-containing protein
MGSMRSGGPLQPYFAGLSGGMDRMRFVIGLLVSFAVGAGCRYFDIPVGSPAVIPGALLVVAMTIGYSSTNTVLNRRNILATTSHLCGGPSGALAVSLKVDTSEARQAELRR